MDRERILFLCTGNSARSQMAEALLRSLAGDRYDVYSAGLEPKGVHPLTIKVLEELDIPTDKLVSKPLTTYLGKVHFSYLITVCGNAEERCPIFPGMGTRLHWPFEDPAASAGTEDEKLGKFREVRDQIEVQIRNWLAGQRE